MFNVIVGINLTFKKQLIKASSTIKHTLAHFKFVGNQMNTNAAKLYMHLRYYHTFSTVLQPGVRQVVQSLSTR